MCIKNNCPANLRNDGALHDHIPVPAKLYSAMPLCGTMLSISNAEVQKYERQRSVAERCGQNF